MKLFSKLDIEFIYRSLGRKPNKKELIVLHDVLEPVLMQRKLLPARFVKQIGLIKNNVHFEIRDVQPNGNWSSKNFLLRDCALHGSWPVQISFIWLFKPSKVCLKNIHVKEKNLTDSFKPVITHHSNFDTSRNNGGKVIVIAIMPNDLRLRNVRSGHLVGHIEIPKPGSTLMHEKRIMNILHGYDSFVSGFALQNNHGSDLRHLLNLIPRSASIDFTFPQKYKKGDGILISKGVSDFKLKNIFIDAGYEYKKVGKINSDTNHVLDFGDGQSKKWPRDVTQISIHGKDEDSIAAKYEIQPERKKRSKKISLVNVVKKMIAAGFPNNLKDELLYDGVGQKIKIGAKHIYQPDDQALFYGSRSIADIVRQLAIEGSNVDSISLITNVNDLAFLAGQQSVIQAFGLREQTQTYFLRNLEQNHHQVIGIGDNNHQKELALHESDFISVLGTIKGELWNSLYTEVTGLRSEQNQPIFDSTLEYNINQALVQAVSTCVIKKVITFSKGGLATALLGLYLELNCEYGIKIHISRKLKHEELLFGESFGSALVIIGEKELMEFQRICMLHGIPSSTIGRLQIKKEISVNNILTIPEKILKTLPE
jgi:hypothetical protein